MKAAALRGMSEAIEGLSHVVARLGGMVEGQVGDAIHACARRDTAMAQSVVARDIRSDAAQKEIEHRAMEILATRRPVARDLREVMAAYKIAGELERVGDLAKSISKRVVVLNESEPIPVARSIGRMGRTASELLKGVLDAYAKKDLDMAFAVWMRDEELDAYYNSLFRDLVGTMTQDPRAVTSCAHLLFVAKNVERVGDHCTNIAEAVHYVVTGEEIGRERPKATELEPWLDPSMDAEPAAERLP